jgi:hypothetical protein
MVLILNMVCLVLMDSIAFLESLLVMLLRSHRTPFYEAGSTLSLPFQRRIG